MIYWIREVERERGLEGVCRPSEGRAAGVVELELAITVVDGGSAH
jgi:hypothetical protein